MTTHTSPDRAPNRVGDSPPVAALLLHICCAPCATYPVEHLRETGFTVRGYWGNPNIHPWQEHEARRLSLVRYSEAVQLPMEWEPGYHLAEFLRQVAGHESRGERCRICYRIRLQAAAACASRLGIPAFTTTLLISPYQDQSLIREAGEEAAELHEVRFHFENFRRGWTVRSQRVREYDLYRQQYCGCLYSEFERYARLPIERAGEAPTC